MALITCEHVCLGYDGQTVLRDVNFTVSRGDLLCVVGENGSGKSTLIKGLLGLKAPEQGSITLGDGLVHQPDARPPVLFAGRPRPRTGEHGAHGH